MNVETLYRAMQDYLYEERETLNASRRLADEANSPVVRYVADLLAKDKADNLNTFEALANALGNSVEFRHDTPAVPFPGDVPAEAEIAALAALNQRTAEGQKRLEALYNGVIPMKNTSLWPEMIQWARSNQEKEARLLKAVLRRKAPALAAKHAAKRPLNRSSIALDHN